MITTAQVHVHMGSTVNNHHLETFNVDGYN